MKAVATFVALLALASVCSCNIDVTLERVAGSDELFTYSFVAARDISVLMWNTPMESTIRSHMFEITPLEGQEGRSWSYAGRIAKRAAAQPEHFRVLAAGTPEVGTINFAELYDFHVAGDYSLRLNFAFETATGEPVSVSSNAITVTVTEPTAIRTASTRAVRDIVYTGCTSNEEAQLVTAVANVKVALAGVLEYLTAEASCITEYEEWFGTYSNSRYSAVREDYGDILAQFNTNNFGLDCTCNDPGVFAQVFPNDPNFNIELCGAFWNAPTGLGRIDSQPGTLTHEMSHFTVIAGTSDHAYGTTDARALAISSPNTAIDNADNFEYLQESAPVCSASCGDGQCTGGEASAGCNVDCVGASPNTVSVSPNTVSVSPNTVSVSPNTVSNSPNSPNSFSITNSFGSDRSDRSDNDNNNGASALTASLAATAAAAALLL